MSLVTGVLLIVLGIREYSGHSHGNGHSHEATLHDQDDHTNSEHGHDHGDDSHEHGSEPNTGSKPFGRLREMITGGGRSHDHSRSECEEGANRELLGIAWFAFVLGFAHEEEFEIIALCIGSDYCLELMSAYAITVILDIVSLTMLLVAGYEHHEEKVEQYTPYLPLFSAAVLIIIGIGFITGLF